ncbi:MAG: aminomethyl transferase family protein [Sphingobium sp.]|nr:aminomethyl transferase family protein [Sphingobium sp.]
MTTAAQPVPLNHVPEVPFDPLAVTYTRFGTGFEPHEYSGWIDESMSWKKTCFIGDWSPLLKLKIKGPDAIRFFSDITVNGYKKFDIGQAKHIIMCNDDGKLMGEGVLMRQGEEEFLFTSGPAIPWMLYQARKGQHNITTDLISQNQFIFQVQGPNALFLLEEAIGSSIRDIGFMRFRKAEIDGMSFDILRQGMAGELGYELHGRADQGVAIYNRLLEIGKKWGLHRLGGRTKMVNHVEACFPTPTVDYIPAIFTDEAAEFRDMLKDVAPFLLNILRPAGSYEAANISDYYRSPVEMGWAKNIKFTHDFIGRAALEKEVAAPKRVMTTLVWNAEDVNDVHASLYRPGTPYTYMEMPRNLLGLMWTDQVLQDGKLVGASTSRCYSYHFREMLSLCVIDPALAAPGTQVDIVWGASGGPQKIIRATVAPAPYKPDNRKIDVHALPSYL